MRERADLYYIVYSQYISELRLVLAKFEAMEEASIDDVYDLIHEMVDEIAETVYESKNNNIEGVENHLSQALSKRDEVIVQCYDAVISNIDSRMDQSLKGHEKRTLQIVPDEYIKMVNEAKEAIRMVRNSVKVEDYRAPYKEYIQIESCLNKNPKWEASNRNWKWEQWKSQIIIPIVVGLLIYMGLIIIRFFC